MPKKEKKTGAKKDARGHNQGAVKVTKFDAKNATVETKTTNTVHERQDKGGKGTTHLKHKSTAGEMRDLPERHESSSSQHKVRSNEPMHTPSNIHATYSNGAMPAQNYGYAQSNAYAPNSQSAVRGDERMHAQSNVYAVNSQTKVYSDVYDSHTVEVDPIVFEYMQRFHRDKLQKIEDECEATFEVSGINLKAVSNNTDCLEKAVEKFSEVYRGLFFVGDLKYEVIDVSEDEATALQASHREYDNERCILTKILKKDGRVQLHIIGPEEKIDETLRMKVREHTPTHSSTSSTPLPSSEYISSNRIYLVDLNSDITLTINVGDITEERVDIIVNTTDPKLKHKSGVSKAIAKAAGTALIRECENVPVPKPDGLPESGVVDTGGGKLHCKHVLHAIGPSKDSIAKGEHISILEDTCVNIFKKCIKLRAQSVALPAIGTGRKGIPAKKSAKAMLHGIEKTIVIGKSSLTEIHIVDIDEESIHDFIKVFAQKYKRSQAHVHTEYSAYGKCYDDDANDDYEGLQAAVDSVNIGAEAPFTHTDTSSENSGEPKHESLNEDDDKCPICMDNFDEKMTLEPCKHSFCKECLDRALQIKNKCPVCNAILGEQIGDQPENGTMSVSYERKALEGYGGYQTIVIDYHFPSGIQQAEHPNPGSRYQGTTRRAYLPDNNEGREVLKLLKKAFKSRLLFTIGRSATTGRESAVVWNDVHHKTSRSGGPQRYGYPDPTYLSRVKEELAAKGIK